MFAPYRFESGALRRKTSAGFASGQGFFLGITPAATGQMYVLEFPSARPRAQNPRSSFRWARALSTALFLAGCGRLGLSGSGVPWAHQSRNPIRRATTPNN
jgi:hypothetical protein